MVRPHTKIGLLKCDKKNIRKEFSGGQQRGRPRIRWLNEVCNDFK